MADEESNELVIPPRMHFPLAKSFSTNKYDQEGKILMLRRELWDGETVNPDDSPNVYPLKWIFWQSGIWFVYEDDGQDIGNYVSRIASPSDMGEEDFLAWDWTTLPPDCNGSSTGACDGNNKFVDLYNVVKPYDANTVAEQVNQNIDHTAPNKDACGDRCSTGGSGILVLPPFERPPAGGGESIESGGDSGSSEGGSEGGEGFEGVGGDEGFEQIVGGIGEGGSPSNSKPYIPKPPANGIIEITTPLQVTPPMGVDIDPCIELRFDACGRKCVDPINPLGLGINGFSFLITDPAMPGALWFYRAYFNGNLISSGTQAEGVVNDLGVIDSSFPLRWGASVGYSVSAWRLNHPLVTDGDKYTLTVPCEYEGNDCNQLPCFDPGSGGDPDPPPP